MKSSSRNKSHRSEGALADIAFLLLIFFMISTTIFNEQGLTVKLPSLDSHSGTVSSNQVISIWINDAEEILLDGNVVSRSDFAAIFSGLVQNRKKAVTSFGCSRGVRYETYIAILDEIKTSYRWIWDEIAQTDLKKKFASCSKEEQRSIIARYPLILSEPDVAK